MTRKKDVILYEDYKAYFQKHLKKHRRKETLRNYNNALMQMEKYKKPYYLREITPSFLLGFRAHLQNKARKNNNKPNAVSRNHYINLILKMMRYAEEKKFLKKRDYTSIKGEPSKKFRKEYHSLPILSEIKARIKKKGDLYTCFLLGTQAGLRKGEITYLEKADYRPDLHAVTIRPKKYWQPKTAASERTVPLQPESEAAVIASIKRAPEESKYIINFGRRRKKRVSYAYIYGRYRSFIKSNFPGLKSFPHIWRHTFASQLLQHDAELKAVSEMMGHSSIATTARYAHLEFDDHRRAAAHMPKF